MRCALERIIRTSALPLALLAMSGSLAHAQSTAASPGIRVTNTAFLNYAYSLSDSIAHVNNFDVARAYINVLGTFEHGISTRVTADIFRPADGTLTYRLKYAFVGWKPEGSPVTMKFGAIQTPWLDWEETLWDYRFQEPMALDRAGYLASSDFGAGIDGSFNNERVNFQAVVVNGEGYSKAPGDAGKDVEARASLRLLNTDDASRVGGLRLTAYGQAGKRTGGGPRDRVGGMLSYRSKLLTLAGEAVATRDRLATGGDADGSVYSAFVVAQAGATPWAFIARADHVDPDNDVSDDGYTTFIAGPSYQIGKPLRVLLDIDHTSYQKRTLAPDVQAAKTRLMFQALVTF